MIGNSSGRPLILLKILAFAVLIMVVEGEAAAVVEEERDCRNFVVNDFLLNENETYLVVEGVLKFLLFLGHMVLLVDYIGVVELVVVVMAAAAVSEEEKLLEVA